ncbi:MAG: Ubiquinone biosynthesis O-methyltransferase [Alphaproteobacteria bacterium MarineAlpha4_Bin2]|nr:MAG: Ubiquinone biosynthesis O-methyltransferase [Alphaproteobacteria bacterium MarineAlpha4_Bin2]
MALIEAEAEKQTVTPAVNPYGNRKEAIRTHFDALADSRMQWITRNCSYYEEDRKYTRFVVPEGARVLEVGCAGGELLARLKPSYAVGLDMSERMVENARRRYPEFNFTLGDIEDPECIAALERPFDYIVLSDTIGYLDDIERTLRALRTLCAPHTRLVIAYYSHLWEPVLAVAERIGQKMPQPEVNFLSSTDITNLLYLSGFEVVRAEWRQLLPKRLLGLGTLINRFIGTLPIIRRLCLRHYIVARPFERRSDWKPSVSILIPCRNEKGNIEAAIQRMPRFAEDMEILYVEGHSSDGTLEECERVRDAYAGDWNIRVAQQDGKGKGDAVRKGFDMATNNILMILDADLTVAPEDLPKFYQAIAEGTGEFINGTRLVYPMEKGAMRFLNYWANRSFALIFSFLLNQRFTDTLCGTKVLSKQHYEAIAAGRDYFGEFDPFGDYDLIFGAAKLNLKITEVPIRYADRTYGEPQISRFRDGFLLLRMVIFAWRKLKAF